MIKILSILTLILLSSLIFYIHFDQARPTTPLLNTHDTPNTPSSMDGRVVDSKASDAAAKISSKTPANATQVLSAYPSKTTELSRLRRNLTASDNIFLFANQSATQGVNGLTVAANAAFFCANIKDAYVENYRLLLAEKLTPQVAARRRIAERCREFQFDNANSGYLLADQYNKKAEALGFKRLSPVDTNMNAVISKALYMRKHDRNDDGYTKVAPALAENVEVFDGESLSDMALILNRLPNALWTLKGVAESLTTKELQAVLMHLSCENGNLCNDKHQLDFYCAVNRACDVTDLIDYDRNYIFSQYRFSVIEHVKAIIRAKGSLNEPGFITSRHNFSIVKPN